MSGISDSTGLARGIEGGKLRGVDGVAVVAAREVETGDGAGAEEDASSFLGRRASQNMGLKEGHN